ncbi:MAG: ATP synthase F1 subunit epsilon [Proteobacteria bacterium]|nr:ATP synthase F1 subunit epsilon [Pseudomonadota bacterium]
MATFKFELVSPERVLVSGEATEVIVPGMDGQFTMLAGHAPVISSLRPGMLDIKLTSGTKKVFVRGGIAEVEPDSLTILAQHMIDLEGGGKASEIDAELKYAEGKLASKDDIEVMAAQDTLTQLRALAR